MSSFRGHRRETRIVLNAFWVLIFSIHQVGILIRGYRLIVYTTWSTEYNVEYDQGVNPVICFFIEQHYFLFSDCLLRAFDREIIQTFVEKNPLRPEMGKPSKAITLGNESNYEVHIVHVYLERTLGLQKKKRNHTFYPESMHDS